jgi:group I intron endonuclease
MAVKVAGVYGIRNGVNGKVYVGRSVDCNGRWKHHLAMLRKGTHKNHHLQSAWSKYGGDVFRLEILETGDDRSLLPALERKWIERLRSGNREHGYNLDTVREGRWVMSDETKAKIGAANRGKVRTPEMKSHLSQVKKGQGKGRQKSRQEIENLKKAHARRADSPDGYAWFASSEGKKNARSAGMKGAIARWGKEKTNGS